MNLRHLLLAGASVATVPPADGAAAPPSPAAPTSKSLDGRRILQSEAEADPTYDAIIALQDGTASIQSSCYVAAPPQHDEVMVWCDIYVPIGLEVKAEIREGTCDAFTDVAEGDSYWLGVASPVFVPEVSDEEKGAGTFAHSYCARMDVLDDADRTGEAASVFEKRFPMEVTYNYYGEVDGDVDIVDDEQTTHTDDGGEKEPLATTAITIDMSGAYEWVDDQTGGEIGGESSSAESNKNENVQDNANTDAGSSTAVYIGLSVLAGAIILFSLGAIIVWEKKRSSRKRREWAETQTMGSEDANEHHATGYDATDEAAFGHFLTFLFAGKNDGETPAVDTAGDDLEAVEVPLEGVPNAQ